MYTVLCCHVATEIELPREQGKYPSAHGCDLMLFCHVVKWAVDYIAVQSEKQLLYRCVMEEKLPIPGLDISVTFTRCAMETCRVISWTGIRTVKSK